MVKAVILASMLALAACQSSAPVENPRAIWCENNEPRRDATPETPRSELDEINTHNAKGVAWCNWSP